MSVCILLFPKQKPPSSEGGDRGTSQLLSSFFLSPSLSLSLSLSLSFSRASTLALLNPEFRNARVCRPPPPFVCMGGSPPYTQLEGESAHTCIPEFRIQERKGTFSVSYVCIYIYIYICIFVISDVVIACFLRRCRSLHEHTLNLHLAGSDLIHVFFSDSHLTRSYEAS